MLAGLPLFDGTSSLPGLSWGTELTSGLYRAGADDYRWVNSTTELLQITTNLLRVSGTAPAFRWNETDAAANSRLWDAIATGTAFHLRLLNDAGTPTNWLSVTRSGSSPNTITFVGSGYEFSNGATVHATGNITTDNTVIISGGSTASPGMLLNSNLPIAEWREADAAADNRRWLEYANGEDFFITIRNDANTVETIVLQVARTGTTVDTINFPNGTLQYGGVEVGYKGFVQNAENSSFNITNTYAGVITYYTSSGHTATIQSTFLNLTGGTTTIANHGSGNLTIATASGTLQWLNGTGAVSTGSRTLAVGGVCTITSRNSTGNPYIWGTGLS